MRTAELASVRTSFYDIEEEKLNTEGLSRLDAKEWLLIRSQTTEQLGIVVPSFENSWKDGSSPDRTSPPTSGIV